MGSVGEMVTTDPSNHRILGFILTRPADAIIIHPHMGDPLDHSTSKVSPPLLSVSEKLLMIQKICAT